MGRKKAASETAPKKKSGKKWIVIVAVAVVAIAAAAGGGNKGNQPGKAAMPTAAPAAEAAASYKLEHGELVSAIENEIDGRSVLVVKAKISSSYNNAATIDQNYYNVEDLVKNQGADKFDEIQYWAVADMSSGSEEKVVSFTVGSELIQQIVAGSLPANQMGDVVADLFIHQTLRLD